MSLDTLKEEVETLRKMKSPKGEQGDRGPKGHRRPKGDRGSAGPQGERGLKGEMGILGEQGPSDPFYLLPYIAQIEYFYIYAHPSRFRSIERTSKDNCRTSDLLDFTGKTISTQKLLLSKDNQQRFFLTLGENRDMLIRDEMDNFFEDNKAFVIFQVSEANDSIVTNLSFAPVLIRFGYQFTGFDGDALYFHIANLSSIVGTLRAATFSNTGVSFDNAAAAPKR